MKFSSPNPPLPHHGRRVTHPTTLVLTGWLLCWCVGVLRAAPASHEEILKRWSGKPAAELRAAAEAGNAEAQLSLVNVLSSPPAATDATRAEALQWLIRAAELKLPAAQAFLGAVYFEGKHVPQAYPSGWKWMRAAAEQGLPYAQNYLGAAYSNGWGIAPDPKEAVRWFQAAKAENFLPAFNNLGWMTMRGQGGLAVDTAAGIKLIQQAAELGHAHSQVDMGWMQRHALRVPWDIDSAFAWFRKSAAQGYAPGQFQLGQAYAQGLGTAPDLNAAVENYRKAAEQGNLDACMALADLQASGEAAPRNASETTQALLERAAEGGNHLAAERLAERFRWGYGGPPDRLKACHWLCRQVYGGFPMLNQWGISRETGRMQPQLDEDSRQFAALYETCRRGYFERDLAALHQLGRWCAEGTVSPVDSVEAYKWFSLAAGRGDPAGHTELAKLRERMTPDQIKDAEQRVVKLNQMFQMNR